MFPGGFRKGYNYENTRRYIRLPAAWPIKCETQAETGEASHVTHTADVSAGGASFAVKESLPLGSRVRIQVHVPPLDRIIQADGRVVRCQPNPSGAGFALGIRFEQIDPKDQAELNETIEQIQPPRKRDRQRGRWWRGVT